MILEAFKNIDATMTCILQELRLSVSCMVRSTVCIRSPQHLLKLLLLRPPGIGALFFHAYVLFNAPKYICIDVPSFSSSV